MELILALIPLLANTLLSVLTGQGITSPAIQQLVDKLIAAGTILFSSLTSSAPHAALPPVLEALQETLTTLEEDTSADPVVIAQVQEMVRMLQSGVAAFEQAQSVTDPSTLTPLPPVE